LIFRSPRLPKTQLTPFILASSQLLPSLLLAFSASPQSTQAVAFPLLVVGLDSTPPNRTDQIPSPHTASCVDPLPLQPADPLSPLPLLASWKAATRPSKPPPPPAPSTPQLPLPPSPLTTPPLERPPSDLLFPNFLPPSRNTLPTEATTLPLPRHSTSPPSPTGPKLVELTCPSSLSLLPLLFPSFPRLPTTTATPETTSSDALPLLRQLKPSLALSLLSSPSLQPPPRLPPNPAPAPLSSVSLPAGDSVPTSTPSRR
jgi:hypothetical protein